MNWELTSPFCLLISAFIIEISLAVNPSVFSNRKERDYQDIGDHCFEYGGFVRKKLLDGGGCGGAIAIY